MPKGPKGEKRPADVIGNAVHVMRIATGEASDGSEVNKMVTGRGRRGGQARAAKLTAEQRTEIAKKAATARWEENAGE